VFVSGGCVRTSIVGRPAKQGFAHACVRDRSREVGVAHGVGRLRCSTEVGAMDDASAIGSFVGVCYGFLENCDIAMTAA
jgi:hypothetical protein